MKPVFNSLGIQVKVGMWAEQNIILPKIQSINETQNTKKGRDLTRPFFISKNVA